jgi:hypothetical protein
MTIFAFSGVYVTQTYMPPPPINSRHVPLGVCSLVTHVSTRGTGALIFRRDEL